MIRRPQRQGHERSPEPHTRTTVRPGRLLLSLLLSVSMVLSGVPAQAFAEAASAAGSSSEASDASGQGDDAGYTASGQTVEDEQTPPANASVDENGSGGGTSESGQTGGQNASSNEANETNGVTPLNGQNLEDNLNGHSSTKTPENDSSSANDNQGKVIYDETPVTFFRLHNSDSGQYRYTSSTQERDSLVGSGWKLEGTSWQTPTSSETPVYLLVDNATGVYTFTTSKDQYEASSLSKKGIALYSAQSTDVPVYAVTKGDKGVLYTTSKDEYDSAVASGNAGAGVAFYALTAGDAKAAETESGDAKAAETDNKSETDEEKQEQPQNAKPAPNMAEEDGSENGSLGQNGNVGSNNENTGGSPSSDDVSQNEQTHVVTFHANGGHFGDQETNTSEEQTYAEGDYLSSNRPNDPSRDDKLFVGWSTDQNGNRDELVDVYNTLAKGVDNLYALWEDPVTVTFDANGGHFGDESSATKRIITYAQNDKVSSRDETPTQDGKSFIGWSYSTENSQDNLVNVYDLKASDVKGALHAVWEGSATVTFDANGGHFGNGAKDTQRVKAFPKSNYLGTWWIETPEKDDEAFVGWSYEKEDATRDNTLNLQNTKAGDVRGTLYAVWGQRVTVTFDAGDGAFSDNKKVHQQNYASGSTFYSWGNEQPSREGYVFGGWSCSENATSRSDAVDFTLTEDVTVHAVWLKAVTYTFHANGGKFTSGEDTGTTNIAIGEHVYWDGSDPVRSDMVFAGWSFSDDNDVSKVVIGDGASTEASKDGSTDLYAVWVSPVTITLDPDGGTFPGGFSGSVTCGQGTKLSWVSPDETPSKSGFVFLGYSTSEGDTTRDKVVLGGDEGREYTANANVTLYAVWAPEVSVIYDAGQGHFGDNDNDHTTTQKLAAGDLFDPWSNQPSREGWSFGGWAVKEDPTKDDATPFTLGASGSVTVHAVWLEAATYTFDANGGRFQDGSNQAKNSVEIGSPVFCQGGYPTKDGRVFAGWSFSKDNDISTVVVDDNTFRYATKEDEEKPLYAVWVDSATITFDANGGSINGGSTQVTETWGVGTTHAYLPGPEANPTRNGYCFVGYAETSDAKESDVVLGGRFGNSYTVTRDVTLYAVWVPEVTITFNANGGKFLEGSGSSGTYTATYAEGETVNPYMSNLTYDGYVLRGWALEPGSTLVVDFDNWGGNYYATKDATLYAVWAKGAKVTFDANGGTFNDGQTGAKTETFLKGRTVSGYNYQVSKGDMLFAGWTDKKDGGVKDVVCGGNTGRYYTVNDDVTLYAVWDSGVTVTYSANGGSFSNGSGTYTQRLVTGQSTQIGETPTQSGKVFVGWSTKKSPTENDVQDLSTVEATNDLKIFAVWVDGITVTYDYNGGTCNGEKSSSADYRKGTKVSSYYTPSRDGYVFAGWARVKDASITDVIFSGYRRSGAYTVNKAETLYAVWDPAVSITADANGGRFYDGQKTFIQKVGKSEPVDSYLAYFSPQPANQNMVWLGWATKRGATRDEIVVGPHNSNVTYTASDGDTLYAVWGERANSTLDANGGTFSSGDTTTASQSFFAVGDKITSLYPQPTWDGHRFMGWTQKKNDVSGGVLGLDDDAAFEAKDGATYYALWSTTYADNDLTYMDDPKALGEVVVTGSNPEKKQAEITVPGTFGKKKVTGIYHGAFADNRQLTSVTIASGITSIGDSAFDGCASLSTVSIPETVTTFGDFCFYGLKPGSTITVQSQEQAAALDGKYDKKRTKVEVTKPFTKAKRTSLEGVCKDADVTVQAGQGTYTNASWSTFIDAVYDAENVLNNDYATQKQVDEAAQALSDAQRGLKKRTNVATLSVVVDKQAWTGQEIRPLPTVKDGNKVLTKGVDYTVSYQNNKKIGKSATVVITGVGDYVGTKEQTFEITGKSISGAKISDIDNQVYSGSQITPDVTVTLNDDTLTKDKDYTVSYDSNVNAGQGTVTVTGIGNYAGTVTKTFKISPRDIKDATIAKIEDQTYNGSAFQPELTVTFGGKKLQVSKTSTDGDYTVKYADNTNVGKATVSISGVGNFTGSTSASFSIVAADLSQAEVSVPPQQYTGKEVKPDPTVTLGGRTLVKDTDYTVTYANNTDIGGEASITVTAKKGSNYTGSRTVNFTISEKLISNAVISDIAAQTYTGSEIKPQPTVTLDGKTLTEGTDYTLSYENNTNVGKGAKVIVTGTGSYAGEVSKSFEIIPKDISNNVVLSYKQDFTYTSEAVQPGVGVTLDGNKLTQGTDYKVDYANNVNAGNNATVTVTFLGNYTGTKTERFTIKAASLAGGTATAKYQTYAGKPLTPDVTVKVKNVTLKKSTDYDVTYGSNTNAGTATFKVTGKGNYEGTLSGSFKINPASLSKAQIGNVGKTYESTGSEIKPDPTVMLNGKKLVKDTDYTVAYKNNVNAGTATVTVTGKGNYTGTASKTFQITKKPTKPSNPSKPAEPTKPANPVKQATKTMYRLYNPNSGEHFYTANPAERDSTIKAGWRYEGIGWIAPASSKTPVYRLYSNTDHHYTTSRSERDHLVAVGWKYEGIGWYSDDAKGVPLYRQFNPNVDPGAPRNNSGSHNYTTSRTENDSLVRAGWRAEGIGWYGVKQ